MKKQTKIAAEEKEQVTDLAADISNVAENAPITDPAVADPAAADPVAADPAAAQQASEQPTQKSTGTFANFEAMKEKIEEADQAIKQNPELAAQMYVVDTSTNPLSFTLTIKPTKKVAPGSLQRPTKKASKILAGAFPAEWLKAMGL